MVETSDKALQDKVKNLHRQRGMFKKSITDFTKRMDRIKLNQDRFDPDEFEVVLKTLRERFYVFEDIQDQLEEIDEETEAPEKLTIQNSYFSAVAEATKLLRNTSIANNTSSTNTNNNINTMFPVPQIHIPKFDGTQDKFDAFFSLYHLTNVLTGKALELIKHLEINDNNYDAALLILKNKYEDKRLLTHRHWSIIRDYPKLKKDTPAALGELVDTFRQRIKALENLQVKHNAWDIALVDFMLLKLNQDTIFAWEMTHNSHEIPKYSDLLEFLEQRARCANFALKEETNTNENKKGEKPQVKKGGISLTTTTTRVCPICSETHSVYSCEIFKKFTQEERYKAAIKASLCLNCLKKGHGVKDCKSTGCRTCDKKHHTFLHRPTTIESDQANTTSVPVADVNKQI
ncbi:uncharacterized protein LOC122859908 [Aphidius gifuensis]|uniref:uncharacterized protein LOC122859908 n=1 Tax=Aphidius gifuensis TaxID=684658 RepID=UPI001CDC545F|nr:uncharacterized protein LOC122859908 [Aphidius gifuensis]